MPLAQDDPTPRTLLERIGAWELGRTLGRGAYAHVRAAKHTVTGHEAACKILPALHRDPDRAVSWDELQDAVEAHKEVVLLNGLNGAKVPGVAGLEGVIEQGGWTYVFLTIYPYSTAKIPCPWDLDMLRAFYRKLLISLHHLHELDISHEDLKRANVMMDGNEEPVLVDFGFSNFNPTRGLVKSLGGTLDYSSPEKAAEKRYNAAANDVWSLGILLTKLLGLPHPYADRSQPDTSARLKERIILGEPQIRFTSDQVEAGIRRVLRGMLKVDPRERWTIPHILKSRFFHDPTSSSKKAFDLPTPKIAMHTVNILPNHVIQDLCFMSYVIGQHHPPETDLKIREKLRGKEPCWEKRWAKMLSKWSQREEMQWEDVPAPPKPRRVSVRSNRAPLREIKVDNTSNLTPVKHSTPKKMTPVRATYMKSVPPLERKPHIFSPKRPIKKVSTMPLSIALQKMGSMSLHADPLEPELGRGDAKEGREAPASPGHSSSGYEDVEMNDAEPPAFSPMAAPPSPVRQSSIEPSGSLKKRQAKSKVKVKAPVVQPGRRITRSRALELTKEVVEVEAVADIMDEDWPSTRATVSTASSYRRTSDFGSPPGLAVFGRVQGST